MARNFARLLLGQRPLVATALAAGGFAGLALTVKDNEKKGLLGRFALRAESPHADPHGMSFTSVPWDSNWDHRQGADPQPTATRHLLLIRHGQYNLAGNGDAERYLTPLGREQASGTGQRLAQLGLPYTKIIQSSMTRAMETAELISNEIPSVPVEKPDDILREGAPIRPEPDVGSWKADADFRADGSRIEAGFRKYFHRADGTQEKDSYEVMVCHANVIRYYVCRVLQLPPEAWLRMSLKHASITWITIRPNGRVGVMCLGDAGHFPIDKLTTT